MPKGTNQEGNAAAALIARLRHFAPLSPAETEALETVVAAAGARTIHGRSDLIAEGERPRALHVMVSGWACRHKTLADGRRQIVALLVPGDLCDLDNHLLDRMDHAIGVLTTLSQVEIGHSAIRDLIAQHPGALAHALGKQMRVTTSMQREWTVNLGQRSAPERLAHLFCETMVRLRGVGLASETGCDFPLTQTDLADATGLTAVHVNRTLQQLRGAGLIALSGRVLSIPDFARLAEAAHFTADYLHMDAPRPDAPHSPDQVSAGSRSSSAT